MVYFLLNKCEPLTVNFMIDDVYNDDICIFGGVRDKYLCSDSDECSLAAQ